MPSVEPLAAFAEALFAHLSRADQRRWARLYLQGLLVAPGRKSVRHLAAAVCASPTAPQSLHQFLNASPWDWAPARRELLGWTERRTAVRALTIGTAILPKRGEHSCGVHRRFVPEAGRTVNCQVGLGLFVSSEDGDVPVDWRLLLPRQWDEDERLRERARIPSEVRHQPLWSQALSLIEAAAPRGSRLPVVAELGDSPDAGPLAIVLGRRGHDFVVAAPPSLRVLPADADAGSSGAAGRASLASHGAMSALALLHRRGGRVPLPVRATGPSRAARSALARLPGTRHVFRLFTEVHPAEGQSPRVWISNLVDRPTDQLIDLARRSHGTRLALDRLERDYGMLDFEGRSYPGWHHHMTLVSAAHAYGLLAGSHERVREREAPRARERERVRVPIRESA
ncbi:transposase [Streptomyces sp. NBC_01275]|uniref:IS701 family transposase n=1 Tax=Streptomyces sp. NBC_01275 TaxID=2903807 RepID=UPI0022508BEE|nr:transposase [Streptomyces sp. NBC_01275]MCX4761528.1 transposase [Streptomyces sp. NBC_01275]